MDKEQVAPPLAEREEEARTASLLTGDGRKPPRRRPPNADLAEQALPAMLTRDAASVDQEERRQPQSGGRGTRALTVAPDSYDATARTVEAVLSAGTAVRRFYFTEELEISVAAIDLSRVDQGVAPLLDTHNQYELSAQIGRIISARVEGDRLIGVLQFADTDRGREIEGRVARGELRAISIGYRVTRWQITATDDTDHETWRAVAWELLEASLVPVPADPNAVVRSAILDTRHGDHEEEEEMRRNLPGGAAVAAPNPPVPGSDPVPEASAAAPGARTIAVTAGRILDLCARSADLGQDFANELIRANEAAPLTEQDLLGRVNERLLAARPAPAIDARAGASGTESEGYRNAVSAAVRLRADPAAVLPEADVAAAREFRGMSLMELARDYLQRTGVAHRGLGPLELAGHALGLRYGAMGTSDFANALSAATSRRVRDAYAAAPQTFGPIVSRGTLPDFKETTIIGLGDAPQLLLVKENAEFTYGAISDTGMTYRLQTYGRIISITRQAIINDHKQLFNRLPAAFGRKAADLESDLVWGILTANPTMADGQPLFHASHGNLAGSGGAIDVTTVAAGEQAMLKQTSPEGGYLSIRPEFLIVGPDKKVEAQRFLTAVTAAQASNVNPYPGTLQLIVEPRITGSQWFLAASPSAFDTLELSHLDGQETLYTETQPGFDVDGVKTKARLDVGAAVIDHRGLYRNPGA